MHTRFSHLTDREFAGLMRQSLDNTVDAGEREIIQEILNRVDPQGPVTIDNEAQAELF